MDATERLDPRSFLLEKLPDAARWVEARSMLRSRACVVAAFSPDPLFAIIHYHRTPTTAVIGTPAGDDRTVADLPLHHEILVQPEDFPYWREILPDRPSLLAILYQLPEDWESSSTSHEVSLVDPTQLASDSRLPEHLRRELPASWSPVATTWLDGRPVSFCYAASETESLWDVSIDTLPQFRRRGAAAACCAQLIDWMRVNRGKVPVWGALASNYASRALARSLGFLPAGQIWVFAPSGDAKSESG